MPQKTTTEHSNTTYYMALNIFDTKEQVASGWGTKSSTIKSLQTFSSCSIIKITWHQPSTPSPLLLTTSAGAHMVKAALCRLSANPDSSPPHCPARWNAHHEAARHAKCHGLWGSAFKELGWHFCNRNHQ